MKTNLTHVFISYSHKNKDLLKELLQYLENEGFEQGKDIWFDKEIKGGDIWWSDIRQALNEAFVLIFIMTPDSLPSASPYYTMEWSIALGSGLPIIPLYRGGLEREEIPEPLRPLHYISFDRLDELAGVLREYKSNPPDLELIQDLVSQIILPLRYYIRILITLLKHSSHTSSITTSKLINNLGFELVNILGHISDELKKFLLTYAFPITTNQKRMIRNLISDIYNFRSSFKKATTLPFGLYQKHLSSLKIPELEVIEKLYSVNLEPIFSYFDEDTYSKTEYREIELILEAIEWDRKLQTNDVITHNPLNIIKREFENKDLAEELITHLNELYLERFGKPIQ